MRIITYNMLLVHDLASYFGFQFFGNIMKLEKKWTYNSNDHLKHTRDLYL